MTTTSGSHGSPTRPATQPTRLCGVYGQLAGVTRMPSVRGGPMGGATSGGAAVRHGLMGARRRVCVGPGCSVGSFVRMELLRLLCR